MKIPPRKPLSRAATDILSGIRQGNPDAIRRRILGALDRCFANIVPEKIQALEEAVCAHPDEETQVTMGDALRRGLGILRMPIQHHLRVTMAETAHVIVTVPFTLSGSSPISSLQALQMIGGDIDRAMDNLRDPHGAGLQGLVVSVPARDTSPDELIALNFMLSNPESDSADAEYAKWWTLAGQTTIVAHQEAHEIPWFERMGFFYAFAMALPGVSPLQAISEPLALTDYGNRVVDVIMGCVDKLNRANKGLKIHLSEVCSLADGILVSMINGLLKSLDSTLLTIPRTRSEDVSPAPLVKMLASMETTQEPLGQFLCSSIVDANGSYVANQRLIAPIGAPRARIMSASRAWASKHDLVFDEKPRISVVCFPKNALGVFAMRDEAGVWRDPSILKGGPAMYGILKTGEWAIGWDSQFTSKETAKDFDALLRALPDPIRQERAGLQSVLQAHYTDTFFSKFLACMRRPGVSRESCFLSLDEEYGSTLYPLIERGHASQLLPSEQMYAAAHFNAAKGALFVVRRRLLDALNETDLSDDYPTEALRGPFKDCYFHFEVPASLTLDGEQMHIEGFYLCEESPGDGGNEKDERLLTILPVVNATNGALSFVNDALRLECSPNDGKTLRNSFDRLDSLAAESGLPDAERLTNVFKDFWRTLVKVLLYTTLPDFRQRVVSDRSNAIAAAKERSGSSRQNALKRASALYDYISIGPESDAEDETQLSSSTGTNKKQHVRRGSYVWQPYGPAHSLRRSQWRRPTIVNRTHEPDPPPKTYKVG